MPYLDELIDELWLMPRMWLNNDQTFTSPGTWTKPAGVDYVEVICVGGGGGGGGGLWRPASAGFRGGGGGGGAVVRGWVPVTGPVAVTVGSGGTGGVSTYTPLNPAPTAYTYTAATDGGTSSFGPVTPPIPSNTVYAGGGGFGGAGHAAPPFAPYGRLPGQNAGNNAPTTNGGGGGAGGEGPVGGSYGYGYRGGPGGPGGPAPATYPSAVGRENQGGGSRSSFFTTRVATGTATSHTGCGLGFAGYGEGGTSQNPALDASYDNPPGPGSVNTGRGGNGGTSGPNPTWLAYDGGNGDAGCVIVRWRSV